MFVMFKIEKGFPITYANMSCNAGCPKQCQDSRKEKCRSAINNHNSSILGGVPPFPATLSSRTFISLNPLGYRFRLYWWLAQR